MKDLYLIRGVSGSGKSAFAESVCRNIVSADMYFEDEATGEYNFDASKLGTAHKWCKVTVETFMRLETKDIAVANTFTTTKEMKPYYKLAEEYGYRVFSIIVENRHGGTDSHNVPEDTLKKQEARFNVKLR